MEPHVFQEDTVFPLPGSHSEYEVEIHAMDPELFRYMTDPDAARAGLDGGFGAFGAIRTIRRTVSVEEPSEDGHREPDDPSDPDDTHDPGRIGP